MRTARGVTASFLHAADDGNAPYDNGVGVYHARYDNGVGVYHFRPCGFSPRDVIHKYEMLQNPLLGGLTACEWRAHEPSYQWIRKTNCFQFHTVTLFVLLLVFFFQGSLLAKGFAVPLGYRIYPFISSE